MRRNRELCAIQYRGRVEETDKRVGFRCVTKDIIYSSTLSQYSIYDILFSKFEVRSTDLDRYSYIWLLCKAKIATDLDVHLF